MDMCQILPHFHSNITKLTSQMQVSQFFVENKFANCVLGIRCVTITGSFTDLRTCASL